MPQVPVFTEPSACLEFARDTWSLENAAMVNDQGLFMYLQDVLVVDHVPVAPRLSAIEHLQPFHPTTMEWWEQRRRTQKLDDALVAESRIFCDPRFARDATEDERISAQLGKRERIADVDTSRPKRSKFNRDDDEQAATPHQPIQTPSFGCQAIFKGISPAGATVVWRSFGWRPYCFIQIEALGFNSTHALALRDALVDLCKLEQKDSIQMEQVLAPRLLPFAYDPTNPRAPKKLLWLKISFPTIAAKKKAVRFLSNRDDWTVHPKLFRFPFEWKRAGFYLAEHILDEPKMLMKTMQLNINTWLTIAHDAVRHEIQAVPESHRASISQFEYLVNHTSLIGVFESNQSLVDEPKDSQKSLFARATDSNDLLERDKALWHVRTVLPKHISDPAIHACLVHTNIYPPMVDATMDIEVSGNIKDESIFPEPQYDPYTAYLVVTILSFKGSVPEIWKRRGIKDVNEPFAVLIHSRCPWSSSGQLALEEKDYGQAKVFGCIQDDEYTMYELWSDWVFRVAQTDLLSHFNGDHFDMPYILCRLTGNSMRPYNSYSKKMRASRFPWMCCIWSIPSKPYWKRIRARDKRSKGLGDDDDNAAEEDGHSSEDDSSDEHEDADFEDVDNLVPADPSDASSLERKPEEEITDQTQFDMILQIFGVANLDLMKFVKEIYKSFDEYSLNYLANLKLKDLSKLDVKPKQITEAWHHQDPQLLELVTSYCVRDVVVTVRLDKAFQAFMTMNSLAFASTTPLSTLLVSGSQKRLLNCLVQFSSARGYVCNGIRETKYASSGSYAGGKVQDAVPGIHKTTCVDFASLYPSIMQCKNLCYCTYVPTWMVDKMSQQDRDALILECFEPRPGIKYWFVQSFLGIVPAMLNYFVTRRRQVQRESKQAFESGNESVGVILDLLQLAFKILANATYGFTGVGKTKGPMLGLQAISETTTFLGREAITLCHDRLTDGSFVRFLQAERPELFALVPSQAQVEVVYGDTDSLFFSWTDDLPMDLIFRLGNESGDFLTDEVRRVYVRHTDPNNPFKVEHEKSGWGLYIRKKMYAMIKFEKIPDCEKWEQTGSYNDKALMIRGLRPTRRDTFGLLRSKGKQILKEMLGWQPFDPASGLSRQEHRRQVVAANVARVIETIQATVGAILGANSTVQEERVAIAAMFRQTGELRASYSAEAAVAPHMAVGWKFHYDFGSRVPFVLCTQPDPERLKRPDGLHKPTATQPKYNFSQTYGPTGYNVRDFTKPYKSLYGKAAYARHPDEEYLAQGSTLQINRSHYLQLFSQLVNIIFVPGIPGAEFVPGIFTASRERIHREMSGVVQMQSDQIQVRKGKSIPMMAVSRAVRK